MKFPSYGAAGVLTLCLLSTSVLANSKGTGATGNSGKLASMTCNTCHTGGSAPTVEITGPTTLAAGATGQYKLTIRGGAAVKGGMNVAVSNTAASLDPGAGVKKIGNEIIHDAPKDFANSEVSFDFSLIAPSSGGTVTIFGAGNSTNGNGVESGDRATTATLAVTITGGTSGGTGGGTGGTDAGSGTDTGNEDDNQGGCSATGGTPSLVMFALSAVAMTRLRRRRS